MTRRSRPRRPSRGVLCLALRRLLQRLRHRQRRPVPLALRQRVLARDGYRCTRCGRRGPLQLHHIRPVARGGRNTPGNLVTLCHRCHVRAHRRQATP